VAKAIENSDDGGEKFFQDMMKECPKEFMRFLANIMPRQTETLDNKANKSDSDGAAQEHAEETLKALVAKQA
jgi:hypothetical protein